MVNKSQGMVVWGRLWKYGAQVYLRIGDKDDASRGTEIEEILSPYLDKRVEIKIIDLDAEAA